uniref:ADP-ribosylglycohydrolase n=1 Tax=Pithovirus LCPAC304 TaxID=2506594 RepID=A0A481Z7L6_9VIRU|nr:MAG: ADP-ribosylglycohydrolase [Pithovirus LCPAC304]
MSEDTTFWWNVLAMFYGGALGDALGIPFEFRYSIPVTKYHGKLEYRPMMKSRFQGTRYGVIGQWSN